MHTREGIILTLAVVFAACGGDSDDGNGGTGPTGPSADISASVSAPAQAAVGTEITFGITVSNAGPDPAQSVVVTLQLPADVSVSNVSDGGSASGQAVSWPAIPSLASGASQQYSVTAVLTAAGQLTATVSATSSTDDPDSSNNDGSDAGAQAVVTASVQADLAVSQTTDQVLLPGATATITVKVLNGGPSDATAVVASDTLAAGLIAANISDGGSQSGNAVSWPAVGSLAAGDSIVRTFEVTAPLVGPITYRAAASASEDDPDQSNNLADEQSVIGFDTLAVVSGESAGDQFGWLLENLGDITGDGVSDFIVGAPNNDAGGTDAGRAYVYSGADRSLLFTFTGAAAGERFGAGVDRAGDIDGDGTEDIIVGGPATVSGGAGRVAVFSGADGSTVYDISGAAGENFGFAVARAGDVDNDGTPDFIVGSTGANGGAGEVTVFSGTDGSVIHSGGGTGALGAAVGTPGDVDGDGISDFMAGSPGASGGGAIRVYSGIDASLLYSIGAGTGGQSLGQFWLEGLGDVDGDGTGDIFGSDIGASGSTGRAFVYSGVDGSTIHTFVGEASGDQFGIGRSGGDADGDGITDVFVAAWRSSEGAGGAGKAYLYSGATGQLLRTMTSTTSGENLGFDAVGVGDLDGDGEADYLLSGGLGQGPGRVVIVKGVAVN